MCGWTVSCALLGLLLTGWSVDATIRCYSCFFANTMGGQGTDETACNPVSKSPTGNITIQNCTGSCKHEVTFRFGNLVSRHLTCENTSFCKSDITNVHLQETHTNCCISDLCNHPFPPPATSASTITTKPTNVTVPINSTNVTVPADAIKPTNVTKPANATGTSIVITTASPCSKASAFTYYGFMITVIFLIFSSYIP